MNKRLKKIESHVEKHWQAAWHALCSRLLSLLLPQGLEALDGLTQEAADALRERADATPEADRRADYETMKRLPGFLDLLQWRLQAEPVLAGFAAGDLSQWPDALPAPPEGLLALEDLQGWEPISPWGELWRTELICSLIVAQAMLTRTDGPSVRVVYENDPGPE